MEMPTTPGGPQKPFFPSLELAEFPPFHSGLSREETDARERPSEKCLLGPRTGLQGVGFGVTAMVQTSVGSKIPAGPGHCKAASLSGLTKLNNGHVACHFLNSEWKGWRPPFQSLIYSCSFFWGLLSWSWETSDGKMEIRRPHGEQRTRARRQWS